MKHSIKNIASSLDQAALQIKTTQQISLTHPISLSEAYEIQKTSIDKRFERGEKLTGYKLGFTSKAKMEQMGVHEIIWGRLTDHMEINNSKTVSRSKFIHPRVEPEIAFLISKLIDKPISLETAADYLQGVTGALEIIDSRYENFKFSLEDVIADNCSSSAYVIGDWLPPKTNVADVSITLKINGEVSKVGNSNAILDNPLASLVEISGILSRHKIPIEPGTIILAGAATCAVYINEGDKIEGQFEGLGNVHLDIIA